MKILVTSQHYYPENFQVNEICESLVKEGHSVTVLTGLPNYPSGIVPEEYKRGKRDEYINGVHVIRCHVFGRKHGAVRLGINYFSFVFSSLRMIGKLDKDFDLVFAYQTSPVLMAVPGVAYAKRYNKPIILYCIDIWPECMKVYIKNEHNPIFVIMKFVSNKIYQACDRVLASSSKFLDYLNETNHVSTDRLSYLPAFSEESYLAEDFSKAPAESKTTNFVFLGNLGIAQNLFEVIDAVELIKDIPNFKFHIVGNGTCYEELQKKVDEKGLNGIVSFYGRRPVEEMPQFYRMADACIVSLKADTKIGWTLPWKVQGYMAAGKPIIGMIDGSAKDVIETSGCGICKNAGDVAGFAEALKDFIQNRDKYKLCGVRGREYFKANFSKAIFMKKLQEEFRKLVEAHVSI